MRLLVRFLLAFLVTLGVALYAPFSPLRLPDSGCRPTPAAFDKLKAGMSRAEANTALGCAGIESAQPGGVLRAVWRGSGLPYEVITVEFADDKLQSRSLNSIVLYRP